MLALDNSFVMRRAGRAAAVRAESDALDFGPAQHRLPKKKSAGAVSVAYHGTGKSCTVPMHFLLVRYSSLECARCGSA